MVDHLGRIVDGDQILYVIARARKEAGTLRSPVVGTVMTNLGLEVALRESGIEFQRAPVGDRYVLAMLRDTGGTLGGETSGHILCLDKTTTGDGLVSALQVLGVMKQTGRSLAELASGMKKFPQVLLNVKVAKRFDPSTVPSVQEAVQKIEQRMGGDGRRSSKPPQSADAHRNCQRQLPPIESRAAKSGGRTQCAAPSSSEIGRCTARARRMRG
jgi:phosphoglucosamine mutase